MADLNFIMLLIIGITTAVLVGLIGAMGSNWFKEKMMKKRALEFLTGERDNVFNLDGERINVNKFKWKDHEGSIKNAEIVRKVKSVPSHSNPIQESKGISNY